MNVTTATLSLTVDDVDASRDFFATHLGYQVAASADGFVSLTRGDAAADVVLLRRGTEVLPPEQRDQRAGGLILALTVDGDLDAEERRLREAGAPITLPVREEPWGERLFQLTDPNGVVVQLVEWVRPAAVPEAPEAPAETVRDATDAENTENAENVASTDNIESAEQAEEAAMHVISPAPEHTIESPNARMTGLAAPSRGSAELSTWNVSMTAGQTGPEHCVSREQVWTVASGTLEVTSGGVTEKVSAGQTLVLPPGIVRRVHAPQDVEAHVAMRADGVASVPGTEGTRVIPWAE
ncbi:VOC family protein [Streptomyces sp. NPDC093225]|uniref:VOC family protein n=1 Tax=Streptomyces sp. NPDC093225 TaxID=3366034 RepID=UPI00382F127B